MPTVMRLLILIAAMAGLMGDVGSAQAQRSRSRLNVEDIDVEATYYRQPALVAESLERLERKPAVSAQLYFVGFASYADQDVFRKEVMATRELFDARFGTKSRSVVLINHPETTQSVPLATVSNLKLVLNGLAQRMDVKRDVLFLFITSHGAEGYVSVWFPALHPNDLKPGELRTILDQSGIQNRVVVISACHSGSFVPDLKDEHTLVLTASSAPRASFGCSNEREWTYFGDALFNHALRETRSFTKAFTQAKVLIDGWEKAGKLESSEPQIALGARIDSRLQALERSLSEAQGDDTQITAAAPPARSKRR